MLTNLSIRNYALIDNLEIDFFSGFTTITGETGAGKSIILDALSLIIGKRADSQVLKDKTQKCIIEGSFDIQNYQLGYFFENHSLDYDSVILLRREINAEGKSRAFLNDTPVSLTQMKEIGDKLLDIHAQHNTLLINELGFQLFVVDHFANIFSEVNRFREKYAELKEMKKKLQSDKELEKKSLADTDYYTFLYNEIEQASLIENEQNELEKELEILNHIGQIKTSLTNSLVTLQNAETNSLQQINSVYSQLSQISKYDDNIAENTKRLHSIYIELKDIVQELQQIEDKTVYSPERNELITQRLNEIYRLQQKHHVSSISELMTIKNDLDEKLQGISSLSLQIDDLEKKIKNLEDELLMQAETFSAKRKQVFPELEKKAVSILVMLGMPDAKIKIENNKTPQLTENGIDDIVFTFSANKGYALEEISKIASGGEISRLMLVFKSLVSQYRLLPTIIFDEIDSGMSGQVASKTGQIMKELSAGMQVFAITHLAQIAAKGDRQYQVYKTADDITTLINIKKLSENERVDVLAEMVSGKKRSDASVTIAKQLLS